MKKGKLIVIDGNDGSGKATQTELLLARLVNEDVPSEKIDFPQYKDNFSGRFLAECLGKVPGKVMPVNSKAFVEADPRLASYVYATDRMESKPRIEEWLKSGKLVIADRYVSSNQIHQAGKIRDEETRKRFLEWLDELEHKVFGVPRPHIIVYLHVPVSVSMELARERAKAKNESPDAAEINAQYQCSSQESALFVIGRFNDWVKVDCAPQGVLLSREEIHELVWRALKEKKII